MFAYCGNNPVNYTDPAGHAYSGISSQFNYNEYLHTYGGLRENFYAGSFYESNPDRVVQDRLTVSRGEIEAVYYDDLKHTEISNSHKIKTTQVMREFVEATRAGKVSGSTTGVVFEWEIHNWGYEVGSALASTNIPGISSFGSWLRDRGEHVAYGQTIYDDDHPVFNYIMWILYANMHPSESLEDLITKVFE